MYLGHSRGFNHLIQIGQTHNEHDFISHRRTKKLRLRRGHLLLNKFLRNGFSLARFLMQQRSEENLSRSILRVSSTLRRLLLHNWIRLKLSNEFESVLYQLAIQVTRAFCKRAAYAHQLVPAMSSASLR